MSLTPICDFLKEYIATDKSRLHMPGHKGKVVFGPEPYDITEVRGADNLFVGEGIIGQSEAIAGQLFGSRQTFYSAGGSSQSIKAMLYLALAVSPQKSRTILAGRNAHKSFLHACALVDIEPIWLYPEHYKSLCSCDISPEHLAKTLDNMPELPLAVYINGLDYLGQSPDLAAFAQICHQRKILLLVDNAHGAYLAFTDKTKHPLALGADICCDSAHKTLPVLTGGAYLHIGKDAAYNFEDYARQALSIFGSTSPSYLIMQSLDFTNGLLAKEFPARLAKTIERIEQTRANLRAKGLIIADSDPLRIVFDSADYALSGFEIGDILRASLVEPEYCDNQFCVLMLSPYVEERDFVRIEKAEIIMQGSQVMANPPLLGEAKAVMSPRAALFAKSETIKVKDALNRVCAAPAVSCPPAIPIVVSGELISEQAIAVFAYYGIKQIDVVVE